MKFVVPPFVQIPSELGQLGTRGEGGVKTETKVFRRSSPRRRLADLVGDSCRVDSTIGSGYRVVWLSLLFCCLSSADECATIRPLEKIAVVEIATRKTLDGRKKTVLNNPWVVGRGEKAPVMGKAYDVVAWKS